jgi:hypothetical protein
MCVRVYVQWLINHLIKSFCERLQVVGFSVCAILGPRVARAYDFTSIYFLPSATELKCFPLEP